MEYKKFDFRAFANHDEPNWMIPGYLIWKRRKNMLAVFPQQMTRKNWRHLLDGSKTVRQHVFTKKGQSNQYELEAIIRAGHNFGTFDIQQYFVNRIKGRARFGKFLYTVKLNGKNIIWGSFESTREKIPAYHPYQPIKTVKKLSAHEKFLAEKRAKKIKKFIAFQNYLKRVGRMSN